MEKIYYNTLKETMYHETMDNGLEVYVLPKLGFEKTYGLFSTNFGSIDTTFTPLGQQKQIKVEDGIAHFLEHKMFDMSDCDASDKFAALGASTNAFTSSSRTAYLFNTTSNEYACITLLLDFVQSLDITTESVEKEKGIIGQEIKMYEDDPDWRVYFGSIQNLYQEHPVAVDIAGSVESVNRTTKEMLETCYETFYHPSNMMLVIVGNVEPEKTFAYIRDNQSKKTFSPKQPIDRLVIKEPLDIKEKKQIVTMDVDMNKIIVSIKINDILKDNKARLKRELSMNIFFDLVFSKSATLYNQWLAEGIINDSFSANITQEKDYCFIQMGGDVDDVEKLETTLHQFIKDIQNIIINEEDFKRILRKNIGNFINAFNSPEGIANVFSRYYFEGIVAMELVDTFAKLTVSDIEEVKQYFDERYTTTCIVKKK
jgi:predicted Zn-dependent peptidase